VKLRGRIARLQSALTDAGASGPPERLGGFSDNLSTIQRQILKQPIIQFRQVPAILAALIPLPEHFAQGAPAGNCTSLKPP